MSKCRVKRVNCKTWTVALANGADPDQTPQDTASDQGLHCSLKCQEDKFYHCYNQFFVLTALVFKRYPSDIYVLISY